MSVIDIIKKRRSIRKYKKRAVEQSKITAILDAANWAPSAGNIQPWRFILVTDKENRKKMAQYCQNQLWVAHAPLIVVLVAAAADMFQAYGVRGTRLYAVQECGAAAQNLVLAATDLGLGSCWISGFDEAGIRSLCGLPEELRPQAVITVGYSAEKVPAPRKRDLHDMYFFEKYGEKYPKEKEILPLKKHVRGKRTKAVKEKITKQKEKLLKRLKTAFK